MLDGDLLAYSSMAISLFSGLFLVAIHTARSRVCDNQQSSTWPSRSTPRFR
jgi:hypothetical protein